MSLPNYLAKIKSSGLYRFTFDKSQIPPAEAETMRLVVGYSEKGPFNNPVYIDNRQDFINIFGNINKRLEKRGVFFHRMALQALSSGPILALNLKPFGELNSDNSENQSTVECVNYLSFNPCHLVNGKALNDPDMPMPEGYRIYGDMAVTNLFDTSRFWKLDADLLAKKISALAPLANHGYINIAATDVKEQSCSIFVRGCNTNSLKEYDVTVRDWYMNLGEEIPEYLDKYADTTKIKDYFAEVFVFKGEFTTELMKGTLKNYFAEDGTLISPDGQNSDGFKDMFGKPTDALMALASDPNSNFVGLYKGCLLPYFKDLLGNYISLDQVFNAGKADHKMLMKLDDSIIEELLEDHNALVDWSAGWANLGQLNKVRNADYPNSNSNLKPIYLKGYEYNSISRLDTAEVIYEKSLGVLALPGIFKALTNHVDSEYHYIIDTFETIISAEKTIGKKLNICEVAKTKDNCLAIMNFPSMAKLIEKIKGIDNLEDIRTHFNLPTEVQGASFCAFYTPLVFGEGAAKTTVPSAALVSNNFMEKWNSRQPYYIVAGPNYGVMNYENMIGPDYNYGKDELDILEPFGANCMVYVPRKGTYINSNQTAKQVPVSALSKVHVRELVIYLQNEIEAMLQNYQWELNTQVLRDTIKTKADTILERIKNNGGVYAYLNVCDSTNNTPEVIDNEMIILDTSIEPARGAGKMVQRLTIHKTGGISTLTM